MSKDHQKKEIPLFVSRRGFIGGTLSLLTAVTVVGLPACQSNITTETNRALPDDILDLHWEAYDPPFNKTREILQPHASFQIERLTDPQMIINGIPRDLEKFRELVSLHKDNSDVNPSFDNLYWQRTAGNEPYFQERNLLEILENMSRDINEGRVEFHVKSGAESPAGYGVGPNWHMQNQTDLFMDGTTPNVGTTHINLNRDAVPTMSTDFNGIEVASSNLSYLHLAIYEYVSRYVTIGHLVHLKENYFPKHPPKSLQEVIDVVGSLSEELIKRGHRFSRSQNLVQYSVCRSLATLSGNANAKITGLELSEDFGIYPLYIASLNGDRKALEVFTNLRLGDQARY